ncbi:MAG: hypothetical protein ACR2LN_01170 [Candidatus Levyibacteriota bacterium]
MTTNYSRGSMLIPVILIVVICLGMLGFIFFKSSVHKMPVNNVPAFTPTQAATSVQSQPTKDFAPNLPMSQKSTITIRLSDSSTMKYIVPKTQVDTYIKNLPKGYTVLSTTK